MVFEQKDNRGVLFKNKDKKEDTHSDWTGEVKIDGKLFWINGWNRNDKNGSPYISLSTKPKVSNPQQHAGKYQRGNVPKPNTPMTGRYVRKNDVPDDEIPF